MALRVTDLSLRLPCLALPCLVIVSHTPRCECVCVCGGGSVWFIDIQWRKEAGRLVCMSMYACLYLLWSVPEIDEKLIVLHLTVLAN